VHGAGAAVAVVGEEVGAFMSGRGCKASFLMAARGLEFVVTAHLDDSETEFAERGVDGSTVQSYDLFSSGKF
jgi:hypothetical protein